MTMTEGLAVAVAVSVIAMVQQQALAASLSEARAQGLRHRPGRLPTPRYHLPRKTSLMH